MDRVAWPARYREMIGNATVPILCYVTERRSLPGAGSGHRELPLYL